MMLVTLAQAKARLRIMHDAEDDDLSDMIRAASAAVMNYLHVTAEAFTDSEGAVVSSSSSDSESEVADDGITVPWEVQTAVLMLVGVMARDRDSVDSKDWEHGYLPKPVIALLYPLRDPALG
jgi:hypothetical protein